MRLGAQYLPRRVLEATGERSYNTNPREENGSRESFKNCAIVQQMDPQTVSWRGGGTTSATNPAVSEDSTLTQYHLPDTWGKRQDGKENPTVAKDVADYCHRRLECHKTDTSGQQ